MATLDVIEFFDESGEEIVHRVPESGSMETKFGSQLVVRDSQTAVLFRDGKGLDVLPGGRHTLSTQNIPYLTKLLTKVVGFGEKSPFRIEVLYVNMKVFTKFKWGTKEPVVFKDSELGMVRLRAFGRFNCKVKEPLLFVNTMVGTQGRYSTAEIEDYLRDVIVSRLNDLLGETLDTIFNLPKIYDEIGVAMKTRVMDDFAKFGLELVDFFVQTITPPEEVQKMIDERTGMGVVGDMNKFMQFQAAKSMRDAAQSGAGGGVAGAGLGAGVGVGLGMMMPGMMQQAMQAQPAQQAPAAAPAAPMKACPNCQAQVPAPAKFCPNCGKEIPAGKKCPKCGKDVEGGAKFCPECGTSMVSSACPKCKTELAPGAKFCPNCGEKMGG